MSDPAIGDRMDVKGLHTMPWETLPSGALSMAQALPSRYLRHEDHVSLAVAIADSTVPSKLSGLCSGLCLHCHARHRLTLAGSAGLLPGVDKRFVSATCALLSLSKAL